jgi:glucose/arabinose dehydrogenase
MSLSRLLRAAAWIAAIVVVAWPAFATDFVLERVATGLSRPVFATSPPEDSHRLFLVEQHTGRIKILDLTSHTVAPTAFLEIGAQLSKGNEQGLLGLAFHPAYARNGFFFVYFTDTSGDTIVRRYRVSADPGIADAGTAMTVLTFDQPQGNHNGGWMGFGPDGFLYIASGDGGGGNDDDAGHTSGIGNGQDITDNLLGKILRVDVDGDDFPGDSQRNYATPATNPFVGQTGDDAIWAYGLRNPYRASFDRGTGDFYIGDVGQNAREEIDFQPAGSGGGENYGWRLREGTIETPGRVGGPRPGDAVDPIYAYLQGSGPLEGFAVIGGYVYRGPVASLQGLYFFGDFVNARVWSLAFDGSSPADFNGSNFSEFIDWRQRPEFAPVEGTLDSVSSFGEDAAGNLYILDLDGDVFVLKATQQKNTLEAGALVPLLNLILDQ